jgi:hypothetical protein
VTPRVLRRARVLDDRRLAVGKVGREGAGQLRVRDVLLGGELEDPLEALHPVSDVVEQAPVDPDPCVMQARRLLARGADSLHRLADRVERSLRQAAGRLRRRRDLRRA